MRKANFDIEKFDRTALEVLPTDMEAKQKLREEIIERSKAKGDNGVGLNARRRTNHRVSHQSRGKPRSKSRGRRLKCYICQYEDHLKTNCPKNNHKKSTSYAKKDDQPSSSCLIFDDTEVMMVMSAENAMGAVYFWVTTRSVRSKVLARESDWRTVKKLRTYNGLELCNWEFEQLCIKSGIARNLTVDEMSQQNRQIKKMAMMRMQGIKKLIRHQISQIISWFRIESQGQEQNLLDMDSLRKNKTWELVDHPAGKKLVSYKWIFKIKDRIEGVQNSKYKASNSVWECHSVHGGGCYNRLNGCDLVVFCSCRGGGEMVQGVGGNCGRDVQ
nr:retrovirus-related Pol polyprotein from transposon TNT 1-94 [Tanacetum cinerariifolium]